ncbi:MAG TPA: isoprenylcysteine carboxylmethyltransferase family protein [Anaerolineales bacterium]|nr:isoprenylcysteine carboxylmethyltransferase family protein [Anaerolineales bacterium]
MAGIVSAAISFLLNYCLLPFPATLLGNAGAQNPIWVIDGYSRSSQPLIKFRSEGTMIDEVTFQTLFIFTAVVFVILWGRNLVSIGITRDKFYTATEGIIIAVPRFLLLGASLAGILVYSIDPHLMKWSALPLPFWLRWFGFFIGLTALIIFFAVLQALGQNFSTTLTVKKDQTLVTQGPYQWVRHPMYTSFVLLWVGYFLLSTNWFIGLTGILGFALAIVVRTPKEEQMMIERFGYEYIAYMKRTGRYLPRRLGKRL